MSLTKTLRAALQQTLLNHPRAFDHIKSLSRKIGNSNGVHAAIQTLARKRENEDFALLQVGSNDGLSNDPIREFIVANPHWKGILVEPIPHLHARLVRNYAYLQRSGLTFVNGAVFSGESVLPMYRIRPDRLSSYGAMADLIASFDRNHVVKHYSGSPRIEQDIETISVPCYSVKQLLALGGLDHLDLLHVDIEGAEPEFFRSFPFKELRPALIIYESIHLSEQSRQAIEASLRSLGYGLTPDGMDTIAILDPIPPLTT